MQMNTLESCVCFELQQEESNHSNFYELRDKCDALCKVFIPNGIWETFQDMTQSEQDGANHQSMLLLAYERGYLHKMTSPVHKYLLDSRGNLKRQVSNDYIRDLQEKWMFENGELRRHQVSRIYRGKVSELQCAEWLEEKGWEISNLEALGGAHDIEAVSPEGSDHIIEIKFVGQDDKIFKYTNNLNGASGVGSSSPYKAHDFLLVKTYEAASKSFTGGVSKKRRLAILVIENVSWPHFKLPVADNWIDIKAPTFKYRNPDSEWLHFLEKNGLLNSDRQAEPSKLISITDNLDELWIVQETDGFCKNLVKQYHH
jgi:hypothetical protein